MHGRPSAEQAVLCPCHRLVSVVSARWAGRHGVHSGRADRAAFSPCQFLEQASLLGKAGLALQ